MNYAGLGWESAKRSIETLIAKGFIRYGGEHSAERPRYEIVPFSDLSQLELQKDPLDFYEESVLNKVRQGSQPKGKSERSAAERLHKRGLIIRDEYEGCYSAVPKIEDDPEHLIWFPNSIVLGTQKGEESPVKRLRRAGDIWALRLFVDLYHAHNLRDEGGINRHVIWTKYERHRAGEQGAYVVWGFERKEPWLRLVGPFATHTIRTKPEGKDHPSWETIHLLQSLRLLSFVPHLFENDTEEAQPVHTFGVGGISEAPIEQEIAAAADAAGRAMCLEGQVQRLEDLNGCEHFCPVINTLPKVQMIGIGRLTYRPHTKRTGSWFAELKSSGPDWIRHYKELSEKASRASRRTA